MNKQPLLIQDAYDFGTPPRKLRETPWEKLYRFFFGDDVFISYSRADAIRYAPSLAARLAAKGHICFFDQLAAAPSVELPERLKKKILRSTVFVLVGTKGAVSSSFVRKEVELFRRTRRPFIPVDVDGALVEQEGWRDVVGVAKIREEGARVRDGDPSPEVVNLIKDSFRYTRRSQWLRASLLAGASVILITAASSLLLIRAAQAKIEAAEAEASAIKRQADAAVIAADKKVGEAQQRLESATAEAADAQKRADDATAAEKVASTRQRAAEHARRQAQQLERQSADRAAETSRREAGSRAAFLSRDPGREPDALALAVEAAEQSLAQGGDLPDEVMDGLTESAMAADYSIPLEGVGRWDMLELPAISPDGEKIVAEFTTYDGQSSATKIVLWDGRTGKIESETQIDVGIYTWAFSRDGKRVASLVLSGRERGLAVWDLSSPQIRRLATACGRGIDAGHTIALDRDGSHVLIGRPPNTPPSHVTICEISTGREEVLPGLEHTLSVAFSPEDEPAAYGVAPDSGGASRPFLYFPRSGRGVKLKLPAATVVPRFMSFANDGSVILTIMDGTTPGQSRIYIEGPGGNLSRLGGYKGVVVSAAYVDGQVRAVTISGRGMRVTDGRSLPNFAALRGHIRQIEVGEFAPDGRTILTVSDDGKGRLWDAQTGSLRHTLAIGDEDLVEGPLRVFRPKRAAFRADGRRLVTANDKGEVQTWDVDTGRLVCSAPGPKVSPQYPNGVPGAGGNHVAAVAFLAGGDYTLAAYRDTSDFINFLDARTCTLVRTFYFDEPISYVSFSQDGATMITRPIARTIHALENMTTQSWSLRGIDLQSRQPMRLSSSILHEPPGILHYPSSDGTPMLLWTDGTLHVWWRSEAHPVRLERSEFNSRVGIQNVFSADGTRVAAVSGREAWVWDTRSGKLLVTFKDEVPANWERLMSLSADGSKMLIACKDNTARIYPTSREGFLWAARRLLGR